MNKSKIIYSINVEDIETVIEEEGLKKLTKSQLNAVIERIPDYFDWYECILDAINDVLNSEPS